MKILILGYSNLCRRKIIPVLKKKFSNVKFSICSRSQKKKNIGAYDWFRDYKVALKKSKTDVVYISLINSLHYYWAKKFLENNYHVIIDKPATLNFKQAKNLVKLARKKKRLLSEAVVFHYHHQINKAIKEINSLKNLTHVHARFVIPKFPKKNFHNFKKYGGGCLLDMGPYAAAVFRIFISKNIKKVTFLSSFKENQNGVNENFDVKIVVGKKSFSGYFSHNGEYENTLTLFTKRKSVTINRVFSPPNDENLILQVSDDHVKKEKKLKKDDAFLNYLRRIIILLKTKRFENSYQNLLKDSFFREKLIK